MPGSPSLPRGPGAPCGREKKGVHPCSERDRSLQHPTSAGGGEALLGVVGHALTFSPFSPRSPRCPCSPAGPCERRRGGVNAPPCPPHSPQPPPTNIPAMRPEKLRSHLWSWRPSGSYDLWRRGGGAEHKGGVRWVQGGTPLQTTPQRQGSPPVLGVPQCLPYTYIFNVTGFALLPLQGKAWGETRGGTPRPPPDFSPLPGDTPPGGDKPPREVTILEPLAPYRCHGVLP